MANINGTLGEDYLNGTDLADLLIGGRGNDYLYGEGGDDIYQLSAGDGADVYYDNQGVNKIIFKDLQLKDIVGITGFDNGTLKINYAVSDSIELLYAGNGESVQPAEYQFSDGSRLSHAELLQKFQISFNGTDNQDEIFGSMGNDLLNGRKANDRLNGGAGDDIYVFNQGDGRDVVSDGEGKNKIIFNGIDQKDISVSFLLGDMILDYGSGQVVVEDFLQNSLSKNWTIGETASPTVINPETEVLFLDTPYWVKNLYPHYEAFSTLNVGYIFPTTMPDYVLEKDRLGWRPFDKDQQALVVKILENFSNQTQLVFNQVTDVNAVNVMSFQNTTQEDSYGFSYYPAQHFLFGSDVFIDNEISADGLVAWEQWLYAHEMGHALGLQHSFEGDEVERFSVEEESTKWTNMSYEHLTYDYEDYSPRAFDTAALQAFYGVNPNARAGNDVYVFDHTKGTLVWDGAGTDTLDAAQAAQRVTIDLREGGWSYIGEKSAFISTPDQLSINFNTKIENATGGAFDDELFGNALNNLLIGGAGADHLYGYQANDVLQGGAGNDWLYGGSGHDVVDGGANNDRIYGGLGDDELSGGSGSDWIEGNDGTDKIIGGSGADRLYGGAGDDTLNGQGGADILKGDLGNDILSGGTDNDQLYGGEGNDQLSGGDGDDQLSGSIGADRLSGGAGADRLIGGSGADWLDGGMGDDEIRAGSGVDHLIGGDGNDRLYGDVGTDRLEGGAGQDVLNGGTGFDALNGGTGADTYMFARGYRTDSIVEQGTDIDQLVFAADIHADQLWFTRNAQDLMIQVIGSTDDIVQIKDWYVTAAPRIEQIKSGDGLSLSHTQVQVLVDAMAGLSATPVGQLNLDSSVQQQLAGSLSLWA